MGFRFQVERIPFYQDNIIVGMIKWHYYASRSARVELQEQCKLLCAEARKRGIKLHALDMLDPPLCELCKKSPSTQAVGTRFFCSRPLCSAKARTIKKQANARYNHRADEAHKVYQGYRVANDTKDIALTALRATTIKLISTRGGKR